MTLNRLADRAFDLAEHAVPRVPGSRCAADPRHDAGLHLVQACAVEALLLAKPGLSNWAAMEALGLITADDVARAMSSTVFDADLPPRLARELTSFALSRAA